MEQKQPAPALNRGIELLQILEQEGHVRLESLAGRTAWPKSSVLRCLQSLQACGMGRRSSETKAYLALQRLVPMHEHFPEDLKPAAARLTDLAEHFGFVVELFVAQRGSLVMIDRAEPSNGMNRVRIRIGATRKSMELDALFAMQLAFGDDPFPEEPLWQWAETGQRTTVDAETAHHFVNRAKERGLLSDRGFNDNGVRRHAMAIRVDRGLVGVLALVQDEKFPGRISEADAILDELEKVS